MKERDRRVFRLIVTLPDEPDLTHWEEDGMMVPFHWPMNRAYLSLTGAQRRAQIFERYGATVEIVRSQPVRWEPEPIQFSGQHWLFELPRS
jgi:hypothetical protein